MRELETKAWTAQTMLYSHFSEQSGKASDCIGCGQCEKMCPQHLPIREWLKKVSGRFEGTVFSDSGEGAYLAIISPEVLAVRGDHISVPVEGFLFPAVQGAMSRVIFVNVDESVTFGHLPGGGADQIHAAPAGRWAIPTGCR